MCIASKRYIVTIVNPPAASTLLVSWHSLDEGHDTLIMAHIDSDMWHI